MATKKKSTKKSVSNTDKTAKDIAAEGPQFDRDNTVFLVDGSGYIFRAYYAIRRLNASDGRATNAVFGFTTMLLKVLREHRPRWIGIAFDVGGKTFRHELFPDYKGNRSAPPEDLPAQREMIQEMVDVFQIARLDKHGWEADDLIATVAKRCLEAGKKVVIITGDKDFMQLVSPDLMLLDELRQRRGKVANIIRREEVIEKFGVPPEMVLDVMALSGDASDNIPGIKGIGDKTAALLVNEHGGLEEIINAAPFIKQKARRERLIAGQDDARLSKKLVTICQDADIALGLDDLTYDGPDRPKLREMFTDLEFRRLLSDPVVRLGDDDDPNFESAKEKAEEDAAQVEAVKIDTSSYAEVTTLEDLNILAETCRAAKEISVVVESSHEDRLVGRITGVAIGHGEGKAAYIPLNHNDDVVSDQLTVDEFQDAFAPILKDESKNITGHNIKDALLAFNGIGIKDVRPGGCVMVAHYLLEQEGRGHSLAELSQGVLGHQIADPDEVLGKGKKRQSVATLAVDAATAFMGEQADVALRLSRILNKRVDKRGMLPLLKEMEMPVSRVLAKVEGEGVKIDTAHLAAMSDEFAKDLADIEERAYKEAGETFLISSPQQVGEQLFTKLKLPVTKRTKTGPSTDSSVLEQLSSRHPLPQIILEHRQLSKLKNTYIDVLPKLIHPQTGRVHTTFNQAVAATGRLSSMEPNLQNIPIRTEAGRRIREAFIADKGNVLCSLDYSQIELRILAHVSDDAVLIDTFQKDIDVHTRTASEIFDTTPDAVSREQRSAAKAINFGLLYGMGVLRLAREIGVKRAEAKEYLEKYWSRFSGVRQWNNDALEKAHEVGEVRTLFGRRRLLHELTSQNRGLVARAERLAINTPIQGSAADLMKRAMVDADAVLSREFPEARMLLQVHDELVIEVPKEKAEEMCQSVKGVMEKAFEFKVPLKVDYGIAENWANAH